KVRLGKVAPSGQSETFGRGKPAAFWRAVKPVAQGEARSSQPWEVSTNKNGQARSFLAGDRKFHKQMDPVRRYIAKQEEHHERVSLQEELAQLLQAHSMTSDQVVLLLPVARQEAAGSAGNLIWTSNPGLRFAAPWAICLRSPGNGELQKRAISNALLGQLKASNLWHGAPQLSRFAAIDNFFFAGLRPKRLI
ncbi:MAG: hypothetical protein HYX74_05170, partial [Acidobacteria bacterium]|nr:hypothetical protein [Acidobacteriota bacterium]